MDTLNKLMAHMRARPLELAELRRQGAKIIGYVPNGYATDTSIRQEWYTLWHQYGTRRH